jgi:hypothetical protein
MKMKNAIRWFFVFGMLAGLIDYWADHSVAETVRGIIMISAAMILAIMGVIEDIYPCLRAAPTEPAPDSSGHQRG